MIKIKRLVPIVLAAVLLTGCSIGKKDDNWGEIAPPDSNLTEDPLKDQEVVTDEEEARKLGLGKQIVLYGVSDDGMDLKGLAAYTKADLVNPEYVASHAIRIVNHNLFPKPSISVSDDGEIVGVEFNTSDPFMEYFIGSGIYEDYIAKEFPRGPQEVPVELQAMFYSVYQKTIMENNSEVKEVVFFIGGQPEDVVSPSKDGKMAE